MILYQVSTIVPSHRWQVPGTLLLHPRHPPPSLPPPCPPCPPPTCPPPPSARNPSPPSS